MMADWVIEQTTSSSSFGEQPHPTSPIREECDFTEVSSDRRRNEEEVEKKEKIKFIQYNRAYIDYARENRKVSTKVERIFWWMVKDRRLFGYKFRRQKVIWSFILDFYCPELLLWIELDGWYHNDSVDYDKCRDAQIYKKGVLVIRFRNEDIEKNLEWVISELEEIVRERKIIIRNF